MSKMQCMLETQFELGSLCYISLAQANGQLRFNLDAGVMGRRGMQVMNLTLVAGQCRYC